MNLEVIIRNKCPELSFIGKAGEGGFAEVAKVTLGNSVYALKVQKLPNINPMGHEFEVHSALSHIKGIPKAHKLYNGAILMDFIEGEMLWSAGKQQEKFFMEIYDTMNGILDAGFSIASDFGCTNIMVGQDNSPWVIDFYKCVSKTKDNSGQLIRDKKLMFGNLVEDYLL